MNPDDIVLENLSKSFEYFKISSEIDECNDMNKLKQIAKRFCKLTFKQQEIVAQLGFDDKYSL